jgi:hypothetical protein
VGIDRSVTDRGREQRSASLYMKISVIFVRVGDL